ncbi:GTP-binding protein LepA [Nocardioides sp. DS6]|uniref:GTP-binding protein LepA n=1 Tax=Nocardioides eburneus TaxID=3231482 RepID=A0ABV3SVN3_9ACTN
MTTIPTLARLADHVDRLGAEHPPLPLAAVDFTVRRPAVLAARFGGVLDYMARAELEVERNVLELTTLLPDPPALDRRFYTEVWGPQEKQHGLILDELQRRLGLPSATTDLTSVSAKLRLVGLLAHLAPVQDVVRMLYYLTGMTTERSALLAYHRLHDGAVALGERAVAETVVTPIRRQEPGHYAYYQLAARRLWSELSGWQRWLVRRLRAVSFTPVGAGTREQRADVGEMMLELGIDGPDEAGALAAEVTRVERELLGAQGRGLRVPPYVARAFRDAVELAEQRRTERAVS